MKDFAALPLHRLALSLQRLSGQHLQGSQRIVLQTVFQSKSFPLAEKDHAQSDIIDFQVHIEWDIQIDNPPWVPISLHKQWHKQAVVLTATRLKWHQGSTMPAIEQTASFIPARFPSPDTLTAARPEQGQPGKKEQYIRRNNAPCRSNNVRRLRRCTHY